MSLPLRAFSRIAAGEPPRLGYARPVMDASAKSERLLLELQAAVDDANCSRVKLERIFESIAEGIAVFDMQGHLILSNQALARICRFPGVSDMQRPLGFYQRIFEVSDGNGQRLAHEQWPLMRALRGEAFSDVEVKMTRIDIGHEFYLSCSGTPLFDQDGKQSRAVLVFRDITVDKRLRQELREASDALERRVAERSAELAAANIALHRAHEELAHSLAAEQEAARLAEAAKQRAEAAMRAAEAANQAKTDFLATMSHEIRTPLNGVIGFTGLLLDGPLTEEKREYAELARRSGEALLHLLNDFLDFSKIEAGHLDLEPVDFDPCLEASHALSLVRESAQKKGLTLEFSGETLPWVRGDAARLRQVLLNLLANAVKFTEHGRVVLSCREMEREADKVWLLFEVTDSGIGIDATARERLFQPFVQADASTTRRFGGTGLGLAISRRLVEAMGGTIGVRSELGKGSTFWIWLPFAMAEVAPVSAQPVEAERAGGDAVRGRVLVVEDNPVSQLMAAEMLKRLGCRVDVAGNGLEAVEAMRRLPYDLVFMDCDMPLMNGFDATRAIRAEERGGRRVPIVAVTASALKGDSERCFAVGMDDFMSKPFRLQDMARMVEAWLVAHQAAEAHPGPGGTPPEPGE